MEDEARATKDRGSAGFGTTRSRLAALWASRRRASGKMGEQGEFPMQRKTWGAMLAIKSAHRLTLRERLRVLWSGTVRVASTVALKKPVKVGPMVTLLAFDRAPEVAPSGDMIGDEPAEE